MRIWHIGIACWIPQATNTHTQCFSTATMVAQIPECYVICTLPVLSKFFLCACVCVRVRACVLTGLLLCLVSQSFHIYRGSTS